jgi:hypothetical protein
MAKRKAARRKAVSKGRKTGRARSSAKRMARRKVAKKTVRDARKTAARKVAARKRAAPKRTAKKQVKVRARARKAPRKVAARKVVARKAVARKVVARKAVSTKAVAPKRAATPRPKPEKVLVRTAPGLNRERRTIRDDDIVQTPPSSLDFDRSASAVRSGRREMKDKYAEHNETSPALTGGDVDADWEGAYSSGDEAPGGDNPTPDQDLVDDIGRAVGIEYQDNEELKGEAKIAKRDRNRWELDPASSDDWDER